MENRRSFIKKSGLFLALSSLSLIAFPFPSRRKKTSPENTIYVTLNVDTGQITNQNLAQTCYFTDQPDDTALEDFTVQANVGDTIIWQGISTNAPSTDIVHIQTIHHHHGRNAFDQEDHFGDDRIHKISKRVQFSANGDQSYKYTLTFTVFNNGNKRGTYRIDPIITSH
jgi:hypothetical protein